MRIETRIKIEGSTCGYWTVLGFISHGNYRCRCVCGVEKNIRGRDLRNGASSSCGCKANEIREQQKAKRRELELRLRSCEALYA